MYKKISIGLLGFLIVLIMPFNINEDKSEEKFYGAATILVRDADGNQLFQQTVHNQLVDTGETFILEQTFQDSTTVADDVQIGSICISAGDVSALVEVSTATDFDALGAAFAAPCIEDTSVDITTTQGQAVIGPLTFTAGTNLPDDATIDGIGICSGEVGSQANFADCATDGILFAFVDTSDVQLDASGATPETVDITYTFDITSSTT